VLKWVGAAAGLALLLFAQRPAAVVAIPLFAHQYGVTCAKCHSVLPHLNEFGAAFLAYGERFPGISSGPAVPLALKLNLVDSSENQGNGPNGAGLPKAIVDEVEVFTSATLGARANFLVEQYIVDGGDLGLLRDAWINDRVNPWNARIPVYLQGGQFTLPLPVDPETFRDTFAPYTPYVQTVGANPFNFFSPKLGARVGVGDPLRGLSVQLFAGPGYDRASPLPATGVDTYVYAQDGLGPVSLSLFHYDGLRPVPPGSFDRFTRNGIGLAIGQWTRFSSEAVLINGWDSNCGIPGHTGCASSGGFEQLRYAFNRRLFAEARYEGTNDPANGFTRDAVFLLGYGPTENSKLSIEDVIGHAPQTTHTMNAELTLAF
jgi:hypothetical protein